MTAAAADAAAAAARAAAAFAAASAAGGGAEAAACAAASAESAARAASTAAFAGFSALLSDHAADAAAAIWTEVRADADAVSSGGAAALADRPLWSKRPPDWAEEQWAKLQATLPEGQDWGCKDSRRSHAEVGGPNKKGGSLRASVESEVQRPSQIAASRRPQSLRAAEPRSRRSSSCCSVALARLSPS